MTNGGGAGVKMSDYAYDEGYRAGMQKMREVGQRRIEELEAKLAAERERGFWLGRSCGGSKAEIDAALAAIREGRE